MCKHRKKVRSNQACISINTCTELSKTKFSLWILLSQSRCSLELKNFLWGLHTLNALLLGSDPPAPLTLATLDFPLICSQLVLMIYILDITKWHGTTLFSRESNILYDIFLSNNKGATIYKTLLNFHFLFVAKNFYMSWF